MATEPHNLRPDVVEIHIAIVRFIAGFAEIEQTVRTGMGRFLFEARDKPWDPPSPLLDILLDRMTAGPMHSAFVSMSSAVTDMDEDDRAVRDVLAGMLRYFVELRNEIAHATWDVGWENADTGEPVLPTARKVRVGRDGPAPVYLGRLTASYIENAANGCHVMRRLVTMYVDACVSLRSGAGRLGQAPC